MTAAPPTVSALPLAHPDPGVREEAARALVAAGGPEAAAATVPLIAHPDLAVRNLAGDVLVRLGAPAVDALRPALSDADGDVRKFAVDVLAQLPAEPLAPEIAGLLADADANVRLAAVDALGALGAGPFVDRLVACYHAEPLARPNVVSALGTCDSPEGTALVLAALSDADPLVQLSAAEAVAGLDVDALPLLSGALGRETGAARAIVLDALVRWVEARPGAPLPDGIEDDLLDMLADPDPAYRQSAARGLARVAGRLAPARFLAHAGRDETLDVALFGALAAHPAPFDALVEAGPAMVPGPAASFAAALLARGAVPAGALAEAGRFLEDRFEALDADTKTGVVVLCARLGYPELVGVLHLGAADPDPVVAEAAADAVGAAGLPFPALP